MFRARYGGDFESLHSLYPLFIQAENYPAALLCLDPTFSSTLPLRGTTTADPGPVLFLNLAYFKLLDLMRRGDHLNSHPDSMCRKIFAFQSRENDRFFIPRNNYLYMVLSPRSETVQDKGGCVVTHEELKGTLDREISGYIHRRATEQYKAYRRRLDTIPCMTMVTRGECSKQDCQFQHTRPEEMTASWFNARVRLVLLEIRVLHLAGFRFNGFFTCVLSLFATTLNSDDFCE